ncbi:MAG TPA: GNAT family N-acetyltransferase [Alphaproteobacteria bacterium]|nr:GNAT family N-acetyltransferase [Alphaproteobacteria bacterium]
MTDTLRYDRFGPDDAGAHDVLLRQAFSATPERNAAHRETFGPENVRVVRAGAELAAALTLIPMGQYYGGRSVACAGIAGLTVAPPFRGRGVSSFLLTEMFKEAKERGWWLATLYASTVPVYRKMGFEVAGREILYAADTDKLVAGRNPAPELRRAEPGDLPMMQRLKAGEARIGAGMVDRPPALWQRKLEPFGRAVDAYFVCGPSGPEGYLAVAHEKHDRLEVTDWCASTGRAAQQILATLAGHRSIYDRVAWSGGPADLLACHLPDKGWRIEDHDEWLTRIVDVEQALGRRGYPEGLTAELSLAVEDPLLPWNRGTFTLRVAAGRGTVTRGDRASDLTLGIDALAPLYTGHFTPAFLGRAGRLDGPPTALATAALIFSGPAPWMDDHF